MKHHLVEDSEGACGTESLTEGWGVWHLSSISLLIHTASHLQQFSRALHTGQPCSPRQAEDLRQWSQVITVSSFHMQKWNVRVWGRGKVDWLRHLDSVLHHVPLPLTSPAFLWDFRLSLVLGASLAPIYRSLSHSHLCYIWPQNVFSRTQL